MKPAQVNPISDALPFGRLWYAEPNATSSAVGYAKRRSRPHDTVIRVYDDAGNVIGTHEHAGEFKDRNADRWFEFKKRRQFFIRTQNEAFPVAAMRVCNPDRSPFTIHD